MMKKNTLILFIAIFAVFLASGSAMALPFTSSGWVNPNYGGSWNEGTGTGTALYQFYIEEPGFSVNHVEIEFENDIFDVAQFDAGDFSVVSPSGWDTTLHTTSNGIKWSMSSAGIAGTVATSLNDPIEIRVDYALLGADRYGQSAGVDGSGAWDWDEGQAWGQAYLLINKIYVPQMQRYFDLDASGGSTSPVPEPATMLLLGTGLLGLVGTKIRRKFKKS